MPMNAIYFDMHWIRIRKKLCSRENRLGIWLVLLVFPFLELVFSGPPKDRHTYGHNIILFYF
jgi:hypothetical protein